MKTFNMIKKYLSVSIFFLLLLGCSTNTIEHSSSTVEVKVNYLSFAIETYAGVSKNDISKYSSITKLLSDEEVKDIYSLFTNSPSAFYSNVTVRLKIAIPNKKDIYIEETGVVLNGEEVQKINIEGLKKLEKIFNIDLNSNLASELGLLGGTKKKTVVNYYE